MGLTFRLLNLAVFCCSVSMKKVNKPSMWECNSCVICFFLLACRLLSIDITSSASRRRTISTISVCTFWRSEKWKLVSWWWSDKEHTAGQPATPDHSVQCHDFRFLREFWQILSVSFGCEETSEVRSYHNTMKYWHFPFTVSHHNIKRVKSSLCLTPIVQMSLRSGSSDPHFCGHSLLVISTTSLANASLMWNGSSGREPLPWYKTHKLNKRQWKSLDNKIYFCIWIISKLGLRYKYTVMYNAT